jgi:hypothetical protein
MHDHLVDLMYESWRNLDSSVDGLSDSEMSTRLKGGSIFAWTFGHVTNMLDSWLNVRFQGLAPHPVLSVQDFRTGGSGDARDWPRVRGAVFEVRQAARTYLDSGPNLDLVIPYDGSIRFLRPGGLVLWYAVARIAAHHLIHAGEIETTRYYMSGPRADTSSGWGRSLLGLGT